MKRVVLLALLALALPVAASASTCSAGFAVTVGSSCTLADLTFSFTGLSTLPPGGALMLVAGTGVFGSDVNLEFQVGGAPFPTDVKLDYTVTSTATDIQGIDAAFTGTGGHIVEVACASAFGVGGTCSHVLGSLDFTTPNTNFSSTFADVSTIFIDKDITPSGFSSFSDSVLVPEPGTLGLLGTGLIGLGGLVRRKLIG